MNDVQTVLLKLAHKLRADATANPSAPWGYVQGLNTAAREAERYAADYEAEQQRADDTEQYTSNGEDPR